jgi:hypothetical protein
VSKTQGEATQIDAEVENFNATWIGETKLPPRTPCSDAADAAYHEVS